MKKCKCEMNNKINKLRVKRMMKTAYSRGPNKKTKWKRNFVKTAALIAGSAMKKKGLTNFVRSAIKTYGTQFGVDEVLSPMAQWAEGKLKVWIDQKRIEILEGPDTELLGSGPLAGVTSEQSRIQVRPGASYNSKSHQIRFQIGRRPSRRLQMTAKANGTVNRVVFNTIKTALPTTRQYMSPETGFNQKLQIMFNGTFDTFNMADLYAFFINPTNYVTPQNISQSVYAHVHNMNVEVTITNVNQYLPCIVKIHLFKFDGRDSTYFNTVDNCSNFLPDQGEPYMPINAQLTNPVNTGSTQYVTVDPDSRGIMDAPYWKDHCELVKTFTRKLNPQDILDFDYRHYCGPGLRLDVLAATDIGLVPSEAEKYPSTYGILYEVVGPRVEAIQADDVNVRYLGTGPANLAFEFKRTMFMSRPSGQSDDYATSPSGGWVNAHCAITSFTSDISKSASADKIVNFSPTDIISNPSGGTSTQIVIPIMTDTLVKYEQPN